MASQPSTLSTVPLSGIIHKTESALHPVILVFNKDVKQYQCEGPESILPPGGLAPWAQGYLGDSAAEGHPPSFSGLGQSGPRQLCGKTSAKADSLLLGAALSCSSTLWPPPSYISHCIAATPVPGHGPC